MFKSIPFAIFFLVFSSVLSAQRNKNNKDTKPLKLKKVQSITIKDTIVEDGPQKKSDPTPMVAVSEARRKFNENKICQTCDTLVLRTGKEYIILYDVRKRSDFEETFYSDQPGKNDQNEKSFALDGNLKREWQELNENFTKKDGMIVHIFRNTLIKIDNYKKETLNTLDLQKYHKGVLYWSGMSKDLISNESNYLQSTERIAKLHNKKLKSSYNKQFSTDSLQVIQYTTTKNPDLKLKDRMNDFLISEFISDQMLPMPAKFKKNVKKIIFALNDKENNYLLFNEDGQLIGFGEDDRAETTITYKNNLPFEIIQDGVVKTQIFYQNSTVVLKNSYLLKILQLEGDLLLETKQYYIEPKDYQALNLESQVKYKITRDGISACHYVSNIESNVESVTCYSDVHFKIPYTIKINDSQNLQNERLTFDSENNIVSNLDRGGNSIQIVYREKNKNLESIQLKLKNSEGLFTEQSNMKISYEYYK